MRVSAFGCGLLLVLGACDEGASEPRSTARILIEPVNLPEVVACYAVELRDAAGATVFAQGVPDARPATLAEARAQGALCGPAEEALEVTGPCTPGPSTAVTWVVGLFEGGGTSALSPEDYVSPCGSEGCSRELVCVRGTETVVGYDLTIMRVAHQGFFDLAVTAEPPEGVDDVCYAVRVANGAGQVVSATARICSGVYGTGKGGDITYTLACDSSEPDHTVSVWVHPPAGGAWTPPCPAPADDAEDANVATWTGGCEQRVGCLENEDVTVDFDLAVPR